jgi:adenylate cyclase
MAKKNVSKKAIKKILVGLVASLTTGLVIFLASQFGGITAKYMEQLERVFYDLTFKFNYVYTLDNLIPPKEKAIQTDSTIEQRIQVVDIDERALGKLGSYNTWPRSHHAKVVDYLAQGGASSITFDILFKNADFGERNAQSALEVMKQVREGEDWEKYYPAIRAAYNYDSLLIQSIKDAGNVIVCATMTERRNYEHSTQWQPLSTAEWQQKIGTKGTLSPDKFPSETVTVWDLLDNVFPELAQATPYLGLVNVMPDDDGVHRKEPLFHGFPNPELVPGTRPSYYPLITIQTVALLFHLNPNDIVVKPGEYVDMGKPLGIFKDSSGFITTTYPNLSWAMVRELIKKKDQILAMGPNPGQARTLEITHQVIINKDKFGDVTADINDAQTLTAPMVRALLNISNLDSVMNLAKIQGVKLNDTVHLQLDDESKQIKIQDLVEEEEALLTDYGVKVLLDGKTQIATLPNQRKLFLSCNFDFGYDMKKNRPVPSFIIFTPSVLKELLSSNISDLEAIPKGSTRRVGKAIRIPVDEKLHMQVKYIGLYDTKRSKRSFKQISYYELVANRIDQASFQGKVFVLGSTAPALFDLVSAPHEAEFPGVLIHTTILENILNENFLQILDERSQLLIILALALLCAMVANMLPPAVGIALLILFSIGYFLAGLSYFDGGTYIGMARQVLTLVLSYIVIMVIRFVFENREKRFLDRTFKQYISPELIEQMKEAEEMPKLGGEEVYATAYFTDIAGFSSFSEAIGSPEKLVELLNEYLGAMTELLAKEKGTLDKYIGDAIVAIFGAPVKMEDHAQRACVLSLKMQKHLHLLREKWSSEGDKWPKLVHKMHMRIGVNTGRMVVGNMGSEMRKNYTMMGDTVNLAARLESAAKQYGVYIQIADETLQQLVPGTILSRPLDLVVVMGKTEPVLCHELLALTEDATPELLELVRLWNLARTAYIDTRWDEALALFEQCLAMEPNHPDRDPGSKVTPSHVFIKRTIAFKDHPPVPAGEKWDGVYTATSK